MLYVLKPAYNTGNPNVVTAVEENIVGFASRKINRSKFSRKIYSNVGLSTVMNFNHMVSTNMIINFPI